MEKKRSEEGTENWDYSSCDYAFKKLWLHLPKERVSEGEQRPTYKQQQKTLFIDILDLLFLLFKQIAYRFVVEMCFLYIVWKTFSCVTVFFNVAFILMKWVR